MNKNPLLRFYDLDLPRPGAQPTISPLQSPDSWRARAPYEFPKPSPQLGRSLSFETRLWPAQQAALNSVLGGLGAGLLVAPHLVFTALSWILLAAFSGLIIWRAFLLLIGAGLRLLLRRPVPPDRLDAELPVYSILVPAYDEATIMHQLAQALCALDWPSEKLDIQILLEADDPETFAAARAANFPLHTRFVIVPPGGPRTKPNALNFGLAQAHGRYVTVYDAEDIPHPDQLRVAFEHFRTAPDRIVCLQAALSGDNGSASWLAANWSLEYATQFGLLLPAHAAYRLPLLIGGTSNHFRKQALMALGGWDAWNVTEDADLGMRIARAGLLSSVCASVTSEDAPTRFTDWRAQRSRWIKGYIQTWLVLMRNPRKTCAQMGFARFCAMQLSLGGAILTPLLHGPVALFVLTTLLCPDISLCRSGIMLLVAGIFIGFCSDLAAPGRYTLSRIFAIATRVFYWPLLSLAAYRAIWELANAPFFWAKTPHHPRDRKVTLPCSTGVSASASPPA